MLTFAEPNVTRAPIVIVEQTRGHGQWDFRSYPADFGCARILKNLLNLDEGRVESVVGFGLWGSDLDALNLANYYQRPPFDYVFNWYVCKARAEIMWE